MNRSLVNQRLPQIVFTVIALLALLLAQISGLFAAPATSGIGPLLTVSSADAHLPWLGRLFAYPTPSAALTSDPTSHFSECSDVYPQACASLALRDSGDAHIRDLLGIMLTDYGAGKMEQASQVLGYDAQRLADITKGAAIFTAGGVATGDDTRSRAQRGEFVNASVVAIAQYLQTTDPSVRAQLLQTAYEKMFLVVEAIPTDSGYRYDMGMVELVLGYPQMAREHLEVARRLDPHNPAVAFALALADMESNQPQAALDTLQPLYVAGGPNPELQEAYGDAALMAGDADRAMFAYDQLLRNSAYTDWQLYTKYLGATINTGRYRQAIATVTQMLTNYPKEPKLFADRAGLEALSRDTTSALADYDKAQSLDGKPGTDGDAALAQARGDVQGKATFVPPSSPVSQSSDFVYGILAQVVGKADEAKSYYAKVLSTQSLPIDYAAAATANLTALYTQSKQYDQIATLFGSGAFDLSKPAPPGVPFYPYLDAANAFEQAGQLDKATAAYAHAEQALTDAPISTTTYVSVTGNLATNPAAQRGLLHSLWGDTLARNAQDDAAIYQYRLALASWPISYATWHNLGLAYARQGHNDLAEAAWLKAVAINPDFAPAAQALAGLSYERGDLSGGEFALALVNQNSPDRWNFSATSVSAMSSYLPSVGAAIPTGAGTPPDRRFIIFALLLIAMAAASFFPTGDRNTATLRFAWPLAAALTTVFFLIIGPAGISSFNLLRPFYESNSFLTIASPVLLLLIYLLVALLTSALLYGAGSWLQLQVARRVGLSAQHDLSLPGLGLSIASLVVGGFFFGPLLHLHTAQSVSDSEAVPSRRERIRRRPTPEELKTEQERDQLNLALPYLVGIGFALVVTIIFLIFHLVSGLPSLRFAAVIAAAYLASQVISGLGAFGEGVARWRNWLWLPLALVGAAIYALLLTSVL